MRQKCLNLGLQCDLMGRIIKKTAEHEHTPDARFDRHRAHTHPRSIRAPRSEAEMPTHRALSRAAVARAATRQVANFLGGCQTRCQRIAFSDTTKSKKRRRIGGGGGRAARAPARVAPLAPPRHSARGPCAPTRAVPRDAPIETAAGLAKLVSRGPRRAGDGEGGRAIGGNFAASAAACAVHAADRDEGRGHRQGRSASTAARALQRRAASGWLGTALGKGTGDSACDAAGVVGSCSRRHRRRHARSWGCWSRRKLRVAFGRLRHAARASRAAVVARARGTHPRACAPCPRPYATRQFRIRCPQFWLLCRWDVD